MNTNTHRVPVTTPEGHSFLVEIEATRGEEDVSIRNLDFAEFINSLQGIASAIHSSLEAVGPTCATVEFGASVSVDSGKLLAVLAKGSASANVKVTLQWDQGSKK